MTDKPEEHPGADAVRAWRENQEREAEERSKFLAAGEGAVQQDGPADDGRAEDAEIHDMMLCYGILAKYDEPTRMRMLQYIASRLKDHI